MADLARRAVGAQGRAHAEADHRVAWARGAEARAAWLRARGESVEILPALDGHGVDVVFRHTSELTVAECVELSDFILAWGDEHGVQWCRASLGRDAPDSAFMPAKAKRAEEVAA